MKWKNHQITTLSIVFSMTGSLPATAIATVSSALPDMLEFGILKHRSLTHYPWTCVMSALFIWASLQKFPGYFLYIVFYVLIGCLCHMFEDFLSRSGIPIKTPHGKQIGLNFYVLNQPSEGYTALGMILWSTLVAWGHGYLSGEYLSSAADNGTLFVVSFFRQLTF